MDLDRAFAVPAAKLEDVVMHLNTTPKPDGKSYWHLHILQDARGAVSLYVPGQEPMTLEPFSFELD